MTKSSNNSRRRAGAGLLATASLAALCAGGWGVANAAEQPAAAKDKEVSTVNEVVVTGIRKSLQSAVQMKKQTMEVVDSIRAEDIGKLPDPNVAETLTRVPGVQGYRYGGEGASPVGQGSGLTIRGLSGQTAAEVDGRVFFTAGEREFNIEDAIPGLISGLDVYKNPSAEHIEGGIGGLIDVRTRKPFDFKGLAGSASVTERYNDLSKAIEPEYFGLISDRWHTNAGEMGLLLSATLQESYNRSDNSPGPGGTQLYRIIRGNDPEYATAAPNQAYAGRSDVAYLAPVSNPLTLTSAQQQNVVSMSGVQTGVNEEEIHRERKGFDGAFQWKPQSNLEFYVDSVYDYYLYNQKYMFLNPTDSRYVQNLTTTPFNLTQALAVRGGSPSVTYAAQRFASGTFLGDTFTTTGGHDYHPYSTGVIATGAKWSPTSNLDLHFDLSYVSAEQSDDNRDVILNSVSGLSWNVTRSIGAPQQVAISGPALSSPSSWVFNRYDDGSNNKTHDTGVAAQFDLKYHFDNGPIRDLKFGARYASHDSSFNSWGFGGKPLTTDGQSLAANQANAISVNSMLDLVSASHTNWFAGQAGYSGGFLTFSPDSLSGDNVRNRFPLAGVPANSSLPENVLSRNNQSEQTYAGYGVADFSVLNDRIRGNLGVRVVQTDLSAQGWVTDTSGAVATIVPLTKTNSYIDVLPTFNLTGYVTPDTLLRFGYGKGLTRPTFGDLNAAISVNPATGTGSAGNPNLRPLRADSYDLTFEQYFSGSSYVAADVFYKNIDGFQVGVADCETVATAPAYTGTATGCSNGQYFITRSVNSQQGSAKGVELSGLTFFNFLPGMWKNFGAQGSYTYVTTELPVIFNGERIVTRQPFQSNNNFSLAGLYESGFMSARVVYTYRSDFVLFGIATNPMDSRYVKGYGLLDAAVNFNLPHNLTLSITGSNLTNAAPDRYVGEPDHYNTPILRQWYLNGRIYGVSLRYRFGG